MTAVALYFSVHKRAHHPDADEDWCRRARDAVGDAWGARQRLAKILALEPSEVTRTLEGQAANVGLVIKISRHLKIALPESWFDPSVYPWVRAGARAVREMRDPSALIASMEEWVAKAISDDVAARTTVLTPPNFSPPLPTVTVAASLGGDKKTESSDEPYIGTGGSARGKKEKRGASRVGKHR